MSTISLPGAVVGIQEAGDAGRIWQVGSNGIAYIERQTEDFGSYKICWYAAYTAKHEPVVKVNALSISTIHYG